MKIAIQQVKEVNEKHYVLLLDADPAKKSVDDYVTRGKVFGAMSGEECIGIIVLLPTRPETLEIVNLAVAAAHRGKGVATQLIIFSLNYARDENFKTVEIGTGSIGFEQLYLYQKCGFRMTSIERDYFVRHHDEEIIENNLVLRDMVRLSQDLFD